MSSFRRLFRWLPDSAKARVDFIFDKSLGKEFGGPFNGQVKRQTIFRELLKQIPFQAIIETGTFRGVTTSFMANETGLPVYTVEVMKRFYHYARLNLRRDKKVEVMLGDSRSFLETLANNTKVPKQNVFFYLDAHWHDDLPLYKEIELIGNHWKNVVIMIDDFEVPGDDGYKFDDYGNGKKLSLEYIRPLLANNWSVFFPSSPSSEESSIKRGSIILSSPQLENELKQIPSLRSYPLAKLEKANEGSIS